MSKYIKPTISLLSIGTSSASASTCTTSTVEANEIIEILNAMGIDQSQAFGLGESCWQTVDFADYCKFTSGIQVFFS